MEQQENPYGSSAVALCKLYSYVNYMSYMFRCFVNCLNLTLLEIITYHHHHLPQSPPTLIITHPNQQLTEVFIKIALKKTSELLFKKDITIFSFNLFFIRITKKNCISSVICLIIFFFIIHF